MIVTNYDSKGEIIIPHETVLNIPAIYEIIMKYIVPKKG